MKIEDHLGPVVEMDGRAEEHGILLIDQQGHLRYRFHLNRTLNGKLSFRRIEYLGDGTP